MADDFDEFDEFREDFEDMFRRGASMEDFIVRFAKTMKPPHATSMDQNIQNYDPHYTNHLFDHPQTVFLRSGYKLEDGYVKGAAYDYSDRIRQWDWKKAEAAWDAVREQFPDTSIYTITAAKMETYLRLCFDAPHLKLVHILAGVNVSNGYPYQVFGYLKDGDDKDG